MDSQSAVTPIVGDRTRLVQIFLNLLNNAAKFSPPESTIEFTIQRKGPWVAVSVKDQGIGIAPEHQDLIFELFSQVDATLTRSQGGLGIGLSLVRRLVELHGGEIEVSSKGRNLGSEFTVRLPCSEEAAELQTISSASAKSLSTTKLRILIADDNPDAKATLAILLQSVGHDVTTASHGEEALAAANNDRFDVVILDIGMPKMNGYDVARAIRRGQWGQSTLLIAVTGWGQSVDRRNSHEAGFDHHLVKPVVFDELIKLVPG
jgi:CheY-like chemotaxis protein